MTTRDLERLLDTRSEPLLDDLADRIAARLRQPEKLTLSVNEAAKRLGLCQNTIYELLNTGELPGVKFGGRWMVSVPALMEKLKGAG
jgi:excisionase family DNA binding protein